MSETCKCCKNISIEIIDGLCDKCEPIWLNQIEILSKILPKNTSIKELFERATHKTIKIVEQNSSVN